MLGAEEAEGGQGCNGGGGRGVLVHILVSVWWDGRISDSHVTLRQNGISKAVSSNHGVYSIARGGKRADPPVRPSALRPRGPRPPGRPCATARTTGGTPCRSLDGGVDHWNRNHISHISKRVFSKMTYSHPTTTLLLSASRRVSLIPLTRGAALGQKVPLPLAEAALLLPRVRAAPACPGMWCDPRDEETSVRVRSTEEWSFDAAAGRHRSINQSIDTVVRHSRIGTLGRSLKKSIAPPKAPQHQPTTPISTHAPLLVVRRR